MKVGEIWQDKNHPIKVKIIKIDKDEWLLIKLLNGYFDKEGKTYSYGEEFKGCLYEEGEIMSIDRESFLGLYYKIY